MATIKKQDNLYKIKFILSNGHFEGVCKKKVLLAFFALTFVFLSLIILSVTMISIEQVNNARPIGEFIGLVIGFVIAFSLLPSIWLVIIIKNEKLRNNLFVWLEDAIELIAYAKIIGTKYWLGIPLNKLQVDFDLDGVHYVRTTDNEKRGVLDWGRPIGYFSGISKYADKQVKILYSPKYDQVMILKS